MKKYFWILMFALAACGDKAVDQPVTPPDTPEVPEQHAMSFIPGAPALSRATSPLQDTYDIFRVWSYKTTATSTTETVMPGYQVKWLGEPDRWQYDGTTYTKHPELTNQFLKYWDESATRYDFTAIAPYPLPEGLDFTTTSEGFKLSNLTGHSATATDVVVAHQRRTFSPALEDRDKIVNKLNDQQPEAFSSSVPLVFHHIFNRVEYRIYNTGTKRAVINNIDLNFADDRTYGTVGSYTQDGWGTLSSPTKSLMSLNYVTPLNVDPIKAEEFVDKSTHLITYYEIPQAFTASSNLDMIIDIGGEPVSRTFPMPDAAWSPDKDYIYYIHIDLGDGDGDPIYIDLVSVADYKYGGTTGQTQTNW